MANEVIDASTEDVDCEKMTVLEVLATDVFPTGPNMSNASTDKADFDDQ